ncbi:hypothetical protein BHE74_00010028, partial [Ensete ventricosum]
PLAQPRRHLPLPSLASVTLSASLLPTIGSPFARYYCHHSNNSVVSPLRCRSLSASSLHLQRSDRNIVVPKSGKKGKHTFTTAASSSSPLAVTLLATDPPTPIIAAATAALAGRNYCPLLRSISSCCQTIVSRRHRSWRLLVYRLSLPLLDPVSFLNSSTEAFFCTRPSSLCTTTVASAPTSSGTFPTPSAASSFSLSNDNKSTTATLISLPFRSTDHPNRSSISSAEVNRRQTFTAVDNTTISLTSGQDLYPSQELDLAGA